jgi:lipooligosaccharide transport system permease protein
MNLSYRLYYVWKRNLMSYKRFVIPTFLVSLGEPLFYLVTFGIGLGSYIGVIGDKSYLEFLVPGILMSTVMMASTFECLYGTFVRMIHEKIYDALISSPVSAEDVVAGDIAWGVTRGLINGLLLVIVAALLGVVHLSSFRVVLMILLMMMMGFLFSSLAMIVTAFAPNFDFFNYYSELIITPMFFFSGVFFPLNKFPGWVSVLANCLPLTHGVVLSRAIFSGVFYKGLLVNLFVIVAFGAVAFILGLLFMKRRLIK